MSRRVCVYDAAAPSRGLQPTDLCMADRLADVFTSEDVFSWNDLPDLARPAGVAGSVTVTPTPPSLCLRGPTKMRVPVVQTHRLA